MLDALFFVDGVAASLVDLPVVLIVLEPLGLGVALGVVLGVVVWAVLPVVLWVVPCAHPDAATPRINAENATVVSKRFMPSS
jgi:hypothetical protein